MNYLQQSKKNNGLRWLICSWVFFFVVGVTVGAVTVNIIKSRPPFETKPLYGTRDGRIFTNTADLGDCLTFTPLDVPLDESTQEFIFYLSHGNYIDFPFVMGLIQQESSFNTKEISETNDFGLMQINKCNHQWLSEQLGIADFLDPEQNIRAGLYILRTLFEKYDDPAKVLMAYNMGETGAKRLWDKGIFETNYTRKVLTYAEKFKEGIEQ